MIKNKILIPALTVVTIGVIGCTAASQSLNEEEIGLRKSNLYEEKVVLKDKVDYSTLAPGESKLIKRSYENAPPLIPHSVEGLLPITLESNTCLDCHTPEVAAAVNATAVPKTHLASYRPIIGYQKGMLTKDGKKYENTADVKTVAHPREGVSADRYNCSQCHVPQTDNEPLVKNEFNPEFRTKSGDSKSNLVNILDEGVSYRKLK